MCKQSISEKIQQRRQQMFAHSVMYYYFGTSIISDSQFDKWAYELVELQQQHPDISENTIYYDNFKDWDGNSGYNLVIPPKYYEVARFLIECNGNINDEGGIYV